MASKQEKMLKDKLKQLGYPDFATSVDEENVALLHIQGHLICGVDYALEMPDEQLKALIDETVGN